MRRILSAATVTIVTLLASLLVGLAPAHADVCGDSSAQWVPLLGSTWSGTTSMEEPLNTFAIEAVQPLSAAATLLGELPLVGEWAVATADQQMSWTGALEGFFYHFSVHADACDAGKVTEASGGGYNELNESFTAEITRVL